MLWHRGSESDAWKHQFLAITPLAPLAALPSPFLHQFFLDPRPFGLVLIPACFSFVPNTTEPCCFELLSSMHSGKDRCFFESAILATFAVHDTIMLSV